jgi:ribosomal-protein-alanine N-acetyltransferase
MMTSILIPTLETERFNLRAPKASDLDAHAEFRASERARMVGGPNKRAWTFDHLCGVIGHWQMRGYGRWIVADKGSDAPLGLVGLYYPEDWPEPEIGWSVYGPAEGKGIAHEAATAARAYAFDVLGWTTVISLIRTDNARSLALAARMGCQHAGDFVHGTYGAMQIWRHIGRGR